MDTEKIQQVTKEFFDKMTIPFTKVEARIGEKSSEDALQVVKVVVSLEDPKILIGQGGQTLFEVQRVLKMVLNKKLGQAFYLDLDINDYKTKKEEYLKALAREAAKEVFLTKQTKTLPPMLPNERRIIHQELEKMGDVISKSEGEGSNRRIVIMPK